MEDNKKFLIVGLGNPDQEYIGTRHNIGYEALDNIAKSFNVTFSSGRYAYSATAKFKGRTLVLIKPTTYMNLSGKAVKWWMNSENITANNILIISDDIDLPLGHLKMKPKGGGGSHNGLNHIIETLGNSNFPRVRFGIGKNYAFGYQIDYVLGKFTDEERQYLKEGLEQLVKTVHSFVTIGIDKTMNEVNSWKPSHANQTSATDA